MATRDVERQGLEDDRFFSDEIERLRLLLEASSTLLGSLSVETMLPDILELAGRTLAADAYALWRRDAGEGSWSVAAYAGLPESYVESATAAIRGQGDAVLLDEPLVAEDIATADWIGEAHREAHAAAGTRAMLVSGLRYGDRVVGTSSSTTALRTRSRRPSGMRRRCSRTSRPRRSGRPSSTRRSGASQRTSASSRRRASCSHRRSTTS